MESYELKLQIVVSTTNQVKMDFQSGTIHVPGHPLSADSYVDNLLPAFDVLCKCKFHEK